MASVIIELVYDDTKYDKKMKYVLFLVTCAKVLRKKQKSYSKTNSSVRKNKIQFC